MAKRRARWRDGHPEAYDIHPVALYPDVFAAAEAVRAGDCSGAGLLVEFLERSPFTIFSGYLKSDVALVLRRCVDDPAIADRLRNVLLAAVHGPARREFKAYIKLARRLDTPAFRAALERARRSPEGNASAHAYWFLNGMARASGSGDEGATRR